MAGLITINVRTRFVSQIICISQMSCRSEKYSNGRKISTTFGSIQSQKHHQFPKQKSNEQNKQKVFEKLFVVVAADIIAGRFRRGTNRIPSLYSCSPVAAIGGLEEGLAGSETKAFHNLKKIVHDQEIDFDFGFRFRFRFDFDFDFDSISI